MLATARLGTTDMEITRVGFGAWAAGGPWAFGWGEQDDRESVAAIRHAVEQGVNWIDTAAVYGLGHSEEVVAEAVRGLPDPPYIFTKCGALWDDHGRVSRVARPDTIRREVEASLPP
jgi:aryl-alcohol dehydrogenase-like predicted oxidoreductase